MSGSEVAFLNLRWAMALVEGLVAAGVDRAVISPGSRSTPLTLACLRHPGMKSWIQVDERSAAFFALGLAKADRRPVALVCTSGSAPANWFPAVIEASYGLTPLILLTADRPAELRDCGANQTINQAGLFGGQVRASHELPPAESTPQALRGLGFLAARAADQSRWPLPGPVHINVPLREPLVPAGVLPEYAAATPRAVSYPVMQPPADEIAALARELSGRPGLIVCGEGNYGNGFPAALAQLAEALACPVLADPLANLRYGAHDRSRILGRYDAFLRREGFAGNPRPEWVLRFGAVPVSKQLQNYLAACDSAHILVEPHGRWPDPLHQTTRLLRADPDGGLFGPGRGAAAARARCVAGGFRRAGAPRRRAGGCGREAGRGRGGRVACAPPRRGLPVQRQFHGDPRSRLVSPRAAMRRCASSATAAPAASTVMSLPRSAWPPRWENPWRRCWAI